MFAAKPIIHAYRYGAGRKAGEGVRIGVTRYPPRGVPRAKWPEHYFDLRLPVLAPSAELLARLRRGVIGFGRFSRAYENQMRTEPARQVIRLLAVVARSQPISLGCFCEDETRCHRLLLRDLILEEPRDESASSAVALGSQGVRALLTRPSP